MFIYLHLLSPLGDLFMIFLGVCVFDESFIRLHDVTVSKIENQMKIQTLTLSQHRHQLVHYVMNDFMFGLKIFNKFFFIYRLSFTNEQGVLPRIGIRIGIGLGIGIGIGIGLLGENNILENSYFDQQNSKKKTISSASTSSAFSSYVF